MRRSLRFAVLVALASLGAAPTAQAEDFPARPVRIIVGFGPGASADITARVLANRMSQIVGQQFVVENKPGAGSAIAAEGVARAPKDGYTLLLGSSANITNQAITANPAVDMIKDFAPIALVSEAAVILVVHPSTGVKSVKELIALATAAAKRPSIAPDLPTMAEAGMPDFDTSIWFGLMAPAGTPRDIIDRLARAVREAVASNEVVMAWRPQGIDPLSGGPEEFGRHIETESKRCGGVAA